jgi:hypothetical protein
VTLLQFADAHPFLSFCSLVVICVTAYCVVLALRGGQS